MGGWMEEERWAGGGELGQPRPELFASLLGAWNPTSARLLMGLGGASSPWSGGPIVDEPYSGLRTPPPFYVPEELRQRQVQVPKVPSKAGEVGHTIHPMVPAQLCHPTTASLSRVSRQ